MAHKEITGEVRRINYYPGKNLYIRLNGTNYEFSPSALLVTLLALTREGDYVTLRYEETDGGSLFLTSVRNNTFDETAGLPD